MKKVTSQFDSARDAFKVAKFMLQNLRSLDDNKPLIKSYVLQHCFLHLISTIVGELDGNLIPECLNDSGLILICLFDMLFQPLLTHQRLFNSKPFYNVKINVYHPLYPTNRELPMVRAQSVDPSCLTVICALKKLMCVFMYRVKHCQLFNNKTEIFPPFPIVKATEYVNTFDLGSNEQRTEMVYRTLDPVLDQLDHVIGFCFGVDVEKMVEIGEKLSAQTRDEWKYKENLKSDSACSGS